MALVPSVTAQIDEKEIFKVINNNFSKLDAGAQGEHKIGRGFEPVETWSMHWLKDENFRTPVANFLDHETKAIKDYISQLAEHSAFRNQK